MGEIAIAEFVLLENLKVIRVVLAPGSGLKMLLEVIRSILHKYQPVISILDPFQATFGKLVSFIMI